MIKNIKLIKDYITHTDVVLKSQFICEIFPINNEEEAKQFLNIVKEKHPKARHHCYAYIIKNEFQNIENQSDDGEPSKTAGLPMLEILRYENLVNVLVVVTRYFGGTLLGVGGLIRAYSGVLKHTLAKADIKVARLYYGYIINIDYSNNEKLKYTINKLDGIIKDISYEDKVKLIIYLENENDINNIEQQFNAKLEINKIDSCYL
ncbi:MAG: YigZ family protein [Bacilli bacterium]|jgi:uncharacterized YigZ family protein|nr:YigZ family protein [Bacilli bacterium]